MLKPMLASLEDAPLADPGLVYEPKYDGIRVIAEVRPVGPGASVRLWSRLGNEKTAQFPEVVQALARWGQRLRDPVVLDGEVVALDEGGQPTGFQHLQKRIHVTTGPGAPSDAVAFVAFDILRASGHDLRDRPLHERRTALEHLLAPALRQRQRTLRISEQVAGDGRALYDRAVERGWEGLIAKHVDSQYRSGKRTPDWRKLKIVREQEFVVGGWTEPRRGRPYFGALLLGVYESGRLKYVGHTGTGFDHRELARLMPLLRAREVASPPFAERPKTNERPHWTRPELVAQIKFTEWTADGKLRHPVYLGLRDDKRPEDVRREDAARRRATTRRPGAAPAAGRVPGPASNRARVGSRNRTSAERPQSAIVPSPADIGTLVHTLQDLEDARHDATLDLGDGRHLAITNLHKPFWPALGLTKGDLFRYYVRVAPLLLPAIADRPLVMKRYPNGIAGKPFYQHRATDVPHGIRVEPVPGAAGAPHAGPQSRPHVIGGDLLTLLYTTQLAAISQDPWFSRVGTPDMADYVALDLDPSHGVSFRQVLEVARAIRDVLGSIGAVGVPKTSGASGLHIYVSLPPATPYEAGLLFAQLVATVVAHRYPRIATVERSVRARGKRVYVDYLQNIMGKTLATAYSARASDFAGVSTPLTWEEVEEGVDREAFTLTTIPGRLARVGDLWAPVRNGPGVDLERAAALGR